MVFEAKARRGDVRRSVHLPRIFPAQEGAVGEVITFGLPTLRARQKAIDGFCEVTVLPGRTVDGRNEEVLARTPKRGASRRPDPKARPTGAGAK